MALLDEVPAMLRFLFVKEFKVEEASLPKVTDSASKDVLKRSLAELTPLTTWNHESIEAALIRGIFGFVGTLRPEKITEDLRRHPDAQTHQDEQKDGKILF